LKITFSNLLALVSIYSAKYGAGLVYGILISCLLLVILFLFIIFHKLRETLVKHKVCSFFDLSDLSQFKVRVMGKPGTRYYREDGVNSFHLELPHWKYMLEDGSKDKAKWFNKVVWEESVLWLHSGRKIYVLCTDDPWDMAYLVHMLRDSGLDISPCQQELDKQDQLEKQKQSCNRAIFNLIQQTAGEKQKFVEICRERLLVWGYKVADAPQNKCDIDLFVQRKGHPSIVRCLLVSQGQLINLEDMQSLRQDMEQFFADSCIMITTGSVTVAAAGYARENKIDVICGEHLIELMQKNPESIEKEWLDWEMTNNDIISLLDEDCAKSILR